MVEPAPRKIHRISTLSQAPIRRAWLRGALIPRLPLTSLGSVQLPPPIRPTPISGPFIVSPQPLVLIRVVLWFYRAALYMGPQRQVALQTPEHSMPSTPVARDSPMCITLTLSVERDQTESFYPAAPCMDRQTSAALEAAARCSPLTRMARAIQTCIT